MAIRRLIVTALAAAALFLASPVHAGDFGKRGLYLGVNGAYGLDLLSTELAGAVGVPLPPVSYDNSWGLNARVGYRAFSFLALEAEYEWMKGIGINVNGAPVATYKPHTLTGNVKLFLPIWRVQPYLLAGGGVSIYDVEAVGTGTSLASGTGFGFRGGAGLDLYVTESLSLNAEATAVLNTSKFDTDIGAATETSLYYFSLSAGLAYHF